MSVGTYSSLALAVERKLDPRVLEGVLGAPSPPGSLLADFALRVLRNLDNVNNGWGRDDAEEMRMFHSAIVDLAEDLRRNI